MVVLGTIIGWILPSAVQIIDDKWDTIEYRSIYDQYICSVA